jgi:hypothetical protein
LDDQVEVGVLEEKAKLQEPREEHVNLAEPKINM